MRTKLFFAFITVIVVALVSNLIYERLMVRDFEDYVSGAKEDKLYWILATVEGSYSPGRWEQAALHDAAHWAVMLGFDIKVLDEKDAEIISSEHAITTLSPSMKRRMQGISDIGAASGDYEPYPLYSEGRAVGTLLARQLNQMGNIREKETLFKKKGKEFLITSFVIAGGGALVLAVFFSLFLSRPLKDMKKAVEQLARGDFSVRVRAGSQRDELGKLAESFNFMAEALEREEALRKRLTSNIAHELRTPLAIAKANIEAMIDGVVSDTAAGIENVRLEIERLIRLVEGIEDMTKAEASFFVKSEYRTIDLMEFLGGITAKLLPVAEAKGLGLSLSAGPAIRVSADTDKLERIVQNILTNAIKNTVTGGVTVSTGKTDSMFFIKISDTGVGISEEEQPLVFKRFYRGGESGGIGLGLAIVRELVDVMGGRIELQSRVGEGASFTVWLPVKAA
ncbi:MAG: HAMP domain-containing histidine kinase [Nitrospirae bacterium]|nr:HAMP domain-containing histidine kinase [Nitrospirota bacterium]